MAETTIAPKASATKEIIYKLKPTRLAVGFEGERIRCWFAMLEEGTPYEEIFKASFWDVHAYKFQIGDFIRIEPDEGHYTSDLKVMSTGVGGIRVEEYYKKVWGKAEAPSTLTSHYEVKWAGPHHKYRVQRVKDGHIEQAGFNNEADANKWLAENARPLSLSLAKEAEKVA